MGVRRLTPFDPWEEIAIAVVKLDKQEAVRIAKTLSALKGDLGTVFLDVKNSALRIYGTDQSATVMFALVVRTQYSETKNLEPLPLAGSELEASFAALHDLMSDDVASLELNVNPKETSVFVNKSQGTVQRRFRNRNEQVSLTPETIQGYNEAPVRLKNWMFVRDGLKATQSASSVDQAIVRKVGGNIAIIAGDPESRGEVTAEVAGPVGAEAQVVVTRAYLTKAFSQSASFPDRAVSMTIQNGSPLVVEFQDDTTRLTIVLGTRDEPQG